MSRLITAVLATLFVAGTAFAQAPAANPAPDSMCESKAIDKNGKPLVGAAKSSFMKKCHAEMMTTECSAKAIDKNGKPLAGAAKNSFMKKCQAGVKTG